MIMEKSARGASPRTYVYHDPAVRAGSAERWIRYGRFPVWCADCAPDSVLSNPSGIWFHCDVIAREIRRTSSARQAGRPAEGSYISCMSCGRRRGYNTSARWRAVQLMKSHFTEYPAESAYPKTFAFGGGNF